MNCIFCGGKIEKQKVTFTYESGDKLILVKNVPAEVCTLCGERTYSPEITDEILRFANLQFKPVKTIQVPVFDYTEKVAVG